MEYKIIIATKFASEVFLLPISKKEAETYTDSQLEAMCGPDVIDDDWVLDGAIGDEADIRFEVTVYDEDYDMVYSSEEEGEDIGSFCMDEDDDYPDLDSLENYKFEEDNYEAGYYLVKNLIEKWREYSYEIEDDSFHPEKLRYIDRCDFQGLLSDNWTDYKHLTYDNKLLKPIMENGERIDFMGCTLSIYKKLKEGWWEYVRTVGE